MYVCTHIQKLPGWGVHYLMRVVVRESPWNSHRRPCVASLFFLLLRSDQFSYDPFGETKKIFLFFQDQPSRRKEFESWKRGYRFRTVVQEAGVGHNNTWRHNWCQWFWHVGFMTCRCHKPEMSESLVVACDVEETVTQALTQIVQDGDDEHQMTVYIYMYIYIIHIYTHTHTHTHNIYINHTYLYTDSTSETWVWGTGQYEKWV